MTLGPLRSDLGTRLRILSLCSLLTAMLAVVGPAVPGAAMSVRKPAVQPQVSPSEPATATSLSDGPANNSPELVVDPTDDRFVVIANRKDSPDFSCGLQLSGDGGLGWLPDRQTLRLPPGAEKCYAPEAAFDRSGKLYYLFVGLAGGGNRPVGAFLTTSEDRGRSFSDPVKVLGPSNYGVRMALDPDVGHHGRIHLAWIQVSGDVALGGLPPTTNPIMSAYSDDGGNNFSAPIRVSDVNRQRVVAPSLALGPKHTVHIGYVDLGADTRDYQGLVGPTWEGTWTVVLATSSDGGRTFAPGSVVDDRLVPPERVMLIFTMPPPAVAAWSGHVCLAFADARYGDADVFVRCSTGGRRWDPVIRVNQDAIGNGHRQFLPKLSVSSSGRLDVVYLDRTDPLGVTYQTDYAFSTNGGRSFSHPLHLAELASSAGIGARYAGPSAAGQVEFGSRLGLLSSPRRSLAAWPDTRNSTGSTDQDIFTAAVAFPPGRGVGLLLPIVAFIVVSGLGIVGWIWRSRRLIEPLRSVPSAVVEDEPAGISTDA